MYAAICILHVKCLLVALNCIDLHRPRGIVVIQAPFQERCILHRSLSLFLRSIALPLLGQTPDGLLFVWIGALHLLALWMEVFHLVSSGAIHSLVHLLGVSVVDLEYWHTRLIGCS